MFIEDGGIQREIEEHVRSRRKEWGEHRGYSRPLGGIRYMDRVGYGDDWSE